MKPTFISDIPHHFHAFLFPPHDKYITKLQYTKKHVQQVCKHVIVSKPRQLVSSCAQVYEVNLSGNRATVFDTSPGSAPLPSWRASIKDG